MTTLLLYIGAGLAAIMLLAAAIVAGVVTWYDVRERRARQQMREQQGGDHA